MKKPPENFGELLRQTTPKLSVLIDPIYRFLSAPGEFNEDIKDNYATFSIPNGLVAAIFPNKSFIDVLLALPIDRSDEVMFDAVDMDYKWRNLPCGVRITSSATAKAGLARLRRSKKLVASGMVQVQDGEVFAVPKAAFQAAFKKSLRFR